MKIVENFFAPDVADVIESELLNTTIWGVGTGVAGNEAKDIFDYGFASVAELRNSFLASFTEAAVVSSLNIKLDMRLKEIFRMRFGMLTHVGREYINTPHTDFNEPHTTVLIYMNDSDGDTYFYDLFYDVNSGQNPIDYGKEQPMNVWRTVSPKRNKAVVFDGLRYHASSHPIKTPVRLALNINLWER